jgi:hypothetical protein
MPARGVSSKDDLLLPRVSSMTDSDVCNLCLLLRSTLVPSEHGKPFPMQRSHIAGHTRNVGAHYNRSVSSPQIASLVLPVVDGLDCCSP